MVAEVLNPKINFACYCVGYQIYYCPWSVIFHSAFNLVEYCVHTSVHYLFITVVMVMDNRQYKGSA